MDSNCHPETFCILHIWADAKRKRTSNFSEEAGDAIIDWGCSALVRHDGKLTLFDGGSSADILQQNEKALDLDLTNADIAVLSHNHPDHI